MEKKVKNKSLGRGLGAILGEVAEAYENELKDGDAKDKIVELALSKIVPNPYQPRVHFNEESINELAESIKRHGLLQPVIVIDRGTEYVLIAGERRVRASKVAGLKTIKAIVANIDASKFREFALIENIQRESLNPVELAKSYKELIEDYGITHEELSKVIHKSRTQITNTLRLLQLSEYVLDKISKSLITQGHAKVLIGLSENKQKIICDTIIGQKLSVRETEQLVNEMKSNDNKKNERVVKKSTGLDLSAYAEIIKDNVPFKVSVKKSKVEISFSNEDELKEFLKRFTKKS